MTATARQKSPHDATVSAVGGALGWSIFTRVLQQGLSLAGSILVVRWLKADDYGMLAVLRTALAFVTAIAGLGLGQAILRYFPTARSRGDRETAGRLVRMTLLFQVSMWIALVLLVFALSGWLAKISFPLMARYFLLGTVLVGAEILFLATTNLMTAFYDSRGLSLATLGGALVYLAFVTAALYSGLGVPGVLIATASANLIIAVVLTLRLRRRIRDFPMLSPSTTNESSLPISASSILRYSLPFAAITIMNLITWRQSESILLAHLRTMKEAGYFDIAYRVPQMILEFVPGAIWPLLMAGFSEIYGRDREKLNRAISVYYKLLFLLVAPISIVGAALGDRAIVALYGEEMAPAGPICQAFFIIFSISFFSTPMSMAFYVLERPWSSFWLYLVNSIAIVGLDLLLIPRYGLVGAVIPVALVITASPFLTYLVIRRLGVRPAIPFGFLARVYLAAVPCALLYPARFLVRGKVPVALAALAAVGLYWMGLRIFRVLGEEEGLLLKRSGLPLAALLSRLLGIRTSSS
jgi:O-antigen/teichoic acid export membrane protein